MSAEQWRPVVDFPDYYVSDQGRVMSMKHRKPHLMYLKPHDLPYLRVELSRENRQYVRRVHRLVAEAFHGPAPEGHEVRHLNGDSHDNRASNLRWGTRAENMQDMVRHGRSHWANRTECPRGHAYTDENTLRWADGGRVCRTCHRERTNEYGKRNRAARNAYQREWRARRKSHAA